MPWFTGKVGSPCTGREGEERAVFGSHQSILHIMAVTVAKSRCLQTDDKDREASSAASVFRGKEILTQKSPLHSGAYLPVITFSSVNVPDHPFITQCRDDICAGRWIWGKSQHAWVWELS